MNISITINDEKVSLSLSPDITWPIALRALTATIRNLADKTADATLKSVLEQQRGAGVKTTPGNRSALKDEIKGDIADQINFAISNVLNDFAPTDPESELTETAIATLENEIIFYAKEHNITLSKAIKEYQSRLRTHPHAAKPTGANHGRTS